MEEQFKFDFNKAPSGPEIPKPSQKSIDEEKRERIERLRILREQERQDDQYRYGHQ